MDEDEEGEAVEDEDDVAVGDEVDGSESDEEAEERAAASPSIPHGIVVSLPRIPEQQYAVMSG